MKTKLEPSREESGVESGKCFSMLTGLIEVMVTMSTPKINQLCQQLWYMATLHLMSVTNAELQICGRGPSVTVHTLQEMRRFIAHEFNALEVNLTIDAVPVKPADEMPPKEFRIAWSSHTPLCLRVWTLPWQGTLCSP